jgi:hypothetical protein
MTSSWWTVAHHQEKIGRYRLCDVPVHPLAVSCRAQTSTGIQSRGRQTASTITWCRWTGKTEPAQNRATSAIGFECSARNRKQGMCHCGLLLCKYFLRRSWVGQKNAPQEADSISGLNITQRLFTYQHHLYSTRTIERSTLCPHQM